MKESKYWKFSKRQKSKWQFDFFGIVGYFKFSDDMHLLLLNLNIGKSEPHL